ncbi:MAG: (2Fe-2S)-binding protein [Candidatus Eiseniibacteriota bacterium]|nr:MAG: (2Fe-2S)-binding protein [Candidatus Eisenbacteria bacterium]
MMKERVRLKIDGRKVEIENGLSILEASRHAGIHIPTLCFDEALAPYAACRLCVVELTAGRTKRLVASCVYPVEEGAEVKTSTEEILLHRRVLLGLYLARSPEAKRIQELAKDLGAAPPRQGLEETHNCILCGLCVRACKEIVGASAIGFSERGMDRKVEPPFGRGSAACISCGTCTTICPTEAIGLEEIDRVEHVHSFSKKQEKRACKVCASFELVPDFPRDYREWLTEKVGAGS